MYRRHLVPLCAFDTVCSQVSTIEVWAQGAKHSLYSVCVTGGRAAILSVERQWFHSAAMSCTNVVYNFSPEICHLARWNLNKSKRSSDQMIWTHTLHLPEFARSLLLPTRVLLSHTILNHQFRVLEINHWFYIYTASSSTVDSKRNKDTRSSPTFS